MSQNEFDASKASQFLHVRDIVKMDLAFHGARFVLSEFALTALLSVLGGLYFGFFSGQHSFPQILAGCFFLSLALNALTFLCLAISIVRRKDGSQKTAYGLRQIGIYSLLAVVLLLLPFIFPLTAAYQGRK